MISTLIKHSALSAKVYGLYGQRLKLDDFEELLKKRSVVEITEFLKDTPAYSAPLHGINEKLVHRGQIESILKRNLFEEYIKLYKFAKGNDKKTLEILFSKYEIEQILCFIRLFRANITNEFIYTIEDFIIKHSNIDFAKMSNCKTFDEFLSCLIGTDYYSILKNYKFNSNTDFSYIETILYSYYYSNLIKKALPLFKGKIKDLLYKSLGSQIDIINITRIFRLKEYYNSEPSNINLHIIPIYYNINKFTINNMINSKTSQELMDVINNTVYSKLFSNSKFQYIKQYLYNFINIFSKLIMRSGIPSINVSIAYLNLKDIEINNIVAIIEGKRYGMSVEDIKKHLLV